MLREWKDHGFGQLLLRMRFSLLKKWGNLPESPVEGYKGSY